MGLYDNSHIYLDKTLEEIYTYSNIVFLFQIGNSFNTIIHKYVNNITSDHSRSIVKTKNEINEKNLLFFNILTPVKYKYDFFVLLQQCHVRLKFLYLIFKISDKK